MKSLLVTKFDIRNVELIDLEQIQTWFLAWQENIFEILLSIGLSVSGGGISWSIMQLAIVALSFLLATIGARILIPTLEDLVRKTTLRASVLRATAIILRRTKIILFVILLWFFVLAMRAATWDSHSYFLTLIANLAAAWAVISISSRIIRNRTVARLIELGGWVLVTLSLLGILPQAILLLDSINVQFNELRISALTLLQGAVAFTVLIWLAGFISARLDKQLTSIEDLTPTARVLIGKLLRFSLIMFAIITGFYTVGIDLTALTFISGAIGVGLGFGLQKVVSNLVSGIILLLDKSIKPGDVITVGETFGWITSLNARYASVSMRDGREILIPNEDLITQQVQNWSFHDPYVRIEILFGVSYNSDPHKVKALAAEAASAHARVITGNPDFPTVCHVKAFGDSSIDFVLRFFIDDPVNGITNVRGDVFLALWDTFKEHDISIPYPHREVFLHQPPGATLVKNTSI
ncbi:MAG: small-conductance mechanosensitive channel [Maritalea sp.]